MFIEERHNEISEIIKANGKITISEITEKYGISDESARRDLRMLEQKGLCKRTHGGAILAGQVSVRPPKNRNFDDMPIFDNYREISRTAADMIRKNDTVYLTGGSFGYKQGSYGGPRWTSTSEGALFPFSRGGDSCSSLGLCREKWNPD